MEALCNNTNGDNQEKQRGIRNNKSEKKNKKIDLLTIQVPFRLLWQWGVLIIQSYNVAFSHNIGNLNKQLQNLLKHLHVQLKNQNMMLEDLASSDVIAYLKHASQKQKWE